MLPESHSEGAQAPFFTAMPRLRDDALIAHALHSFEQGDHAAALLGAETVCRRHPDQYLPALLRARILQHCRPALSARAWYQAWIRDPELPLLQDALLQSWLETGATASVARLGPCFLPARCRSGQHASLLSLLRQAGVTHLGACWKNGPHIDGRLFLPADAAPQAHLLLSSEERHYRFQVPADGSLFRLLCPTPGGVWSISLEATDGQPAQLLQGSPLAFYAEPGPALPTPVATATSAQHPVSIVVPVYRDQQRVQACLDSVLASLVHNRTPTRVVVVDDASPEPALSAWLDQLAADGAITLLRNHHNLGFIEACNRGMRQFPDHHVLLLNADTLVHGNWIDRLGSALASAADVASVSPWSNNGEISSFPRLGSAAPAPTLTQLAELDNAAAAVHANGASTEVELPSCCGFCMLIRRSVLERIGMLDGAGLNRGYGEEVDWCLRARAAGYRHLAATGVFVAHAGGASFGFEKRLRVRQNRHVLQARYPTYQAAFLRFAQADPLSDARQALRAQLANHAWLNNTGDASDSRTELAAALPAPLPAAQLRSGVWQLRYGTPASAAVLALARQVASLPGQPVRLLIIGAGSEALWHTGVVDLLPSGRGRDAPLLTDTALLGLAACQVVLSDDAHAAAGIAHVCLNADFDARAWLHAWLANWQADTAARTS
ncbi:MAG: glycosyltransferase family 2 protein [Sphingomonadaceae bacterium]